MNQIKPSQKSLAEVIGWGSHSRENQFEEESKSGAAWSSNEGLDVEKIYDQLNKPSSIMGMEARKVNSRNSQEQMRLSLVANKVQGLIQTAGVGLEAKQEAYLKKNRKLINRIRQRLEAEEQARL